MRATPSLPKDTEHSSVIMTARHMADAVGYLTRVANNAGLCGIAGKLTSVRSSLLKVVAGDPEDDDPAEIETISGASGQTIDGERDDGRKPS